MTPPPEILVFLASMTPIGELRLGIPLGKALGLSMSSIIVWAIMGNFTIVLILLKILEPMANFFKKHSEFLKKIIENVFDRTRHKHSKLFMEIGAIALVAFVAVPLPGSGGWTGALVAFLFGVTFWRAAGLILLGLVIAAALVAGGVESIIALANLFR